MVVKSMKLSFTIYDSYSLKDKRSTVKSIIERMQKRHKVSMAEVENQEIWNVGTLECAIAAGSARICGQVLDQVTKEIEENYEVEIFQLEKED